MIPVFAALLTLSFTAWSAAEVSHVVQVEKDAVRVTAGTPPWAVGDFVCVERVGVAGGCGVISVVENGEAVIALDFTNTELKIGDTVTKPKGKLKPSAQPLPEGENITLRSFTRPKNLFRTAMLWDMDQWFMAIEYQRAVTSHVAYGIKVDLFDTFNINKQLDGTGVLLTRNFFTRTSFSGIIGQLGVGAYFLSANNAGATAKAVSFAAEFSAGWRFQIRSWLGWGLQFGLRLITRPDFGGVSPGTFHPVRSAIGTDITIRL